MHLPWSEFSALPADYLAVQVKGSSSPVRETVNGAGRQGFGGRVRWSGPRGPSPTPAAVSAPRWRVFPGVRGLFGLPAAGERVTAGVRRWGSFGTGDVSNHPVRALPCPDSVIRIALR
ncbi:hypothetical protein GCM10023329_01410 [Streptomyces sanyensis]|uniref:Uncharacterized protein n=1 Tax=Streptomyces sanyensis TaxID=568869 RepID=A0ABP8ZMQ3_9ACTN